nr:GH92 family glycosyl hydrolase [Allomuricauda sp.]
MFSLKNNNYSRPVLKIQYLCLCLLISLASCNKKEEKPIAFEVDTLAHVDPFIGTGFHGHTFPGPVMPHGMMQLGPDTKLNGWDASSGYHYADSTIYGFSHTHLSGTGIGDMGDVLLLPFTGDVPESKPVAIFDKADEHAVVGKYSVSFKNFDVTTELATAIRAGMHRYSFSGDGQKKLLVDIGHILQRTWSHDNVANTLEFVDDKTLRGLKHSRGWAKDHKVYYYIEFSHPFSIESVVVDGKTVPSQQVHEGVDVYSYLSFDSLPNNEPLLVKVGISPVDMQGAENNLKTEVPHWEFDDLVEANRNAWEKELGRIKIKTSDDSQRTIFYTALYHSMIAPMIFQDVDGRYRGMDKEIHQAKAGQEYYTVYSMWDTFRALHPLMTIVDEPRSVQWMNDLLLKYQQGGILPKWALASNYTGTMVGYPAVANLADAVAKNIPGIDKDLALEAAVTSASYLPDLPGLQNDPNKDRVMTEHNKYINEGVHIPSDKIINSVSYGLENAYYDWCILQLAKSAGNDSLVKVFSKRAKNYALYFDASTGFMRGKNEDGSWVTPFNPKYSDHEHSDYVEGNAWQWNWFVPHDIEGFADLYGSPEAFTTKLDSLFTTSSEIEGENASGDITGLIGQYAHGNEPSHHIAYMYNYIDQAWKAQELVDRILTGFYTTEPDGIIGNEDCGQMSAWYIMSSMGFYQVAPGDPVYTIGRPLFEWVEIPMENGNSFTIKTVNNSAVNKYVQEVSLNGTILEEPFFTHDDIRKGGELIFTMGPEPKQ